MIIKISIKISLLRKREFGAEKGKQFSSWIWKGEVINEFGRGAKDDADFMLNSISYISSLERAKILLVFNRKLSSLQIDKTFQRPALSVPHLRQALFTFELLNGRRYFAADTGSSELPARNWICELSAEDLRSPQSNVWKEGNWGISIFEDG